MSGFEQLEKELSALSPRAPTKEFTQRIEEALGGAGSVAMCHLNDEPEQRTNQPSRSKILTWGFFSIGLAASFAFLFYLWFPSLENDLLPQAQVSIAQPFSMVDDESPLHGVTSSQLEDLSGIPFNGWLDPYTEEKFIRRVDEGIVDRVTGLPARQYRYHFVDETMWTHPASETRVLSTTPRQEVYLIDLELY
jgi:hypothetical protein